MTFHLCSALLVLPLVFAGCGKSSPATPEAACKHMAKISGKPSTPESLTKCADGMTLMQKHLGKEKADKMLACMMKATDTKSAMQCADIGAGKGATEKYVAKSKASEAKVNLKRMHDGARAYYMDAQASAETMTILEKQFPAPSIGPTPPLTELCAKGEKFAPNEANWMAPVWMALDFSVVDPHYFSYEYKVEGEGAAQEFTVLAYGDLDCDGEYSTFKMGGSVSKDGEPVSSGELEGINELE